MLISLRDKNGKLLIKDVLDIDFDMSVVREEKKYFVAVNQRYNLDEAFEQESDAEERMISLANSRNNLEDELRNY